MLSQLKKKQEYFQKFSPQNGNETDYECIAYSWPNFLGIPLIQKNRGVPGVIH